MNSYLKNRRGLSSVVGALFFTVLMISGFSVLGLALDVQEDIVTTQRVISDIEIKKQQEEFGVLASVDGNDILGISIQNQGQNPVEISSMWIINKTLSDQPAKRYTINYDDAFVSSGFTNNVLSSQTLEMIPDVYGIKVITTLGSIKTVELDTDSGTSSIGLRAELITDPPDVIMGQNVTVALIVTNAGESIIEDVFPNIQPVDFSGAGWIVGSSPNTPSLVDLRRGESVMFTWDYQVDGASGETMIFTANAEGKFGSTDVFTDDVSDTSILRDPADGGSGGEEVVVQDELYGKPQLYLIFPNPLGWDNNDRALWGVNVANPTDQPIEVSKVVIVVVSPRASSSDVIFKETCTVQSSPLNPQTISPTTNNWTCPESNQLQWKNVDAPQIIPPRSVFPFLVKIGTQSIGSTTGEPNNIPIHTTVFSTLGQFGKTGYMSTVTKEKVAMPNVFLATSPGTANPANIIGEIRGIVEGTSITFNATIADMEKGSGNKINAGSRLIINIPKGWTYTGNISHTGFDTPLIEQPFPDGSRQIIGTLTSDLSGSGDIARTIQFTATAPNVSGAKMYVMHILADGTAKGDDNSDFSIGPIAETVLQVCPTSGCP